MALKAGRNGFSEVGTGLEFDPITGRLSLNGETDIKLDGLKDVSIENAADGDLLVYDGTTEEWLNVSPDDIPAIIAKTDQSVIGPVENGDDSSAAYSVGDHFTRNGKFCTCIQSIAIDEPLTLGTNYVEGDISELICVPVQKAGKTYTFDFTASASQVTANQGFYSSINLPFKLKNTNYTVKYSITKMVGIGNNIATNATNVSDKGTNSFVLGLYGANQTNLIFTTIAIGTCEITFGND